MTRKNIRRLLQSILAIGGKRMVTITTPYLGTRVFDIKPDGQIGYGPEHAVLFEEHLEEAVNNGGGIIVRKFTSDTFQGQTPKGMMTLPVKLLFAACGGQGRWVGMDQSQVKLAFSIDSVTQQPIDEEQGVIYQDWPSEKKCGK